MSEQQNGLTSADDEMARARRRNVWVLVLLVLLVGAVFAGHAWWDWYFSAGDLLDEHPIPG